jgi:hypothetical protein
MDSCVWALLKDGTVIAGNFEDEGNALSAHVQLLLANDITNMDFSFKAAGSLRNGVMHRNSCLNSCVHVRENRETVTQFLTIVYGVKNDLYDDGMDDYMQMRTEVEAEKVRNLEKQEGKHPCNKEDCETAATILEEKGYTVKKTEDDEYKIGN